MNLPFYFTTKILSHLSANEVKNALTQYTITSGGEAFKDKKATVINKQQFAKSKKNYLYKATIAGDEFKIQRITGSETGPTGNAFNPFCFGSIHQQANGCEIKLKFRPPVFVLIFMFIWSFGVVFGFSGIFIHSLSQGKYKDALITPIMFSPFFLGWWFFYRYGFKREVYRALSFFKVIEGSQR